MAQTLEQTLTLIRAATEPKAATGGASAIPVIIDAQIIQRLALLQEQLEDYDAEAEDSLDALRADLAGSDLDLSLAPIAKSVAAYDMEAAAEQLAALSHQLRDQYSD